MSFKLTPQAHSILMEKYDIKKSLIVKIEKELNELYFVKNPEDFLMLIENIIITASNLNNEKESFSNGQDTLYVNLSLKDIIIIEIVRKFGKTALRNSFINRGAKTLFSAFNKNFTVKEMNEFYLNQDWPKFEVTEQTRDDVLNNPKRYNAFDFRTRNGMFRTDEEQQKYIEKSLKRKLP